MAEDFVDFKKALGDKLPLNLEPEICFGPEHLATLLSEDDYRSEEVEVMEAVAQELGLSLYHVRPGFARRIGIPASLPYAPAKKGEGVTRANLIAGLERLLAANDCLTAYQSYLSGLRAAACAELPPPRH